MSIKPRKSKNVFPLPIETAIIVPSTKKNNKRIKASTLRNRVNTTRKFLSKSFGGYTSVNAIGGFTTKKGKLIKEPTNVVTSYATRKDYKKGKKKFMAFARKKRRTWGQESLGIIVENDLFFIK